MYWRVKKSNSINIGDPVGTVKPLGYIDVKINHKIYKLHRLIWLYVYNEWPDCSIDHIDRDPSNNRIENLRLASSTAQNYNRQRFNGDGWPKGVNYLKQSKTNPYQVCIYRHYKVYHRSYHPSLTQAAECAKRIYDELERIEHGS